MAGPDEDIDVGLVQRLVRARFPHWADLPVRPIAATGTDNLVFRLGDHLAVRLPRSAGAAGTLAKEQRWLPLFQGRLPLEIPWPEAFAPPGEDWPWPWSVCRWVDGRDAAAESIAGDTPSALALADFLTALHAMDPSGAPRAGEPNSWRGVALGHLDALVQACLAQLTDDIDTAAALAIWRDALAAPRHDGPPVWIHGDLHPGNLVVRDGRLAGVIDFGLLATGDPAVDVMAAWSVFEGEARTVFLDRLEAGDALVRRARGWALYAGAVALPWYRDRNPTLAAISRRTLAEVVRPPRPAP